MSLESETDLTTLRQAVRLLEQENRKLIRLNLELRQALAEAKGDKAQQLELQIAALKLADVDPYDYLRAAAHAALRGEPLPLPGRPVG